MAFSHTIGYSWSGGGISLSSNTAYTASAEYNITQAVGGAETDTEIACVLAVAEIESIYISVDQDMLLEVNNNVGVGGSIALLANIPYTWTTDSYAASEFAVNITAFFVTNATGTAGTFQFRCIVDSTP